MEKPLKKLGLTYEHTGGNGILPGTYLLCGYTIRDGITVSFLESESGTMIYLPIEDYPELWQVSQMPWVRRKLAR